MKKRKCNQCGDFILEPIILGHIFYGKGYVSLDYGCGERLFELGLLKLHKGRNNRFNFRTKQDD